MSSVRTPSRAPLGSPGDRPAVRRCVIALAAAITIPLSGALVAPAVAAESGPASVAVPAAAPQGLADAPIAMARRASSLSAFLTDDRPRLGETIWISGKLLIGGSGGADRKVVVQSRAPGNVGWNVVATVPTSISGRYSLRMRPTLSREYRVIFRQTPTVQGASSPIRTTALVRQTRTNQSRAEVLGSKLGQPTTGLRRATPTVTYRSFSNGMLVTVDRDSTRTWWVHTGILSEYKKRGGPGGSMGVPTEDARCGLVWEGCVQRFTGGVIYANGAGARGVTHVTKRRGEVIAAARSQVGYTVKRRTSGSLYEYYSKFNAWKSSNSPWCGIFQSWSFAASGNHRLVPQSKQWIDFRDTVRRQLPTGGTPRVGALAFVSYLASGAPSHTMLVVDTRPGEIRVIHGNTTGLGALPAGTRGVLEQWVRESQVLYYAYPRY
jgi:hypothetical protein